jgi:hypothetical protein
MKLTVENGSTRGKSCPSVTLSTTNLTWTDPGSNPGLRGGRSATNRLSHGTAIGLVLAYNVSVSSYMEQYNDILSTNFPGIKWY